MKSECKLCGRTVRLCRSHIIPEFIYEPLYDDKHRFTVLSASAPDRYAQRGLTERLLCNYCETQFSGYEKYAADVMTGRLGHRYQKRGEQIEIQGVEYRRFKLFQLSVLWRASVSRLEFFKLVSLGPLGLSLREMLLAEDLGPPEKFGCAVIFATERGEQVNDTFFNPEPLRFSGHKLIKFFFAGSWWLFHCDGRRAPAYLRGLFLQENGTYVGVCGDLHEARRYGRTARKLARQLGW